MSHFSQTALATRQAEPDESRFPAGKLLIVDDLPDNRAVLTRRFERRGFEIVEADCGPQALRLVDEQSFDCVLLDVMMPGMDGTEVLRQIREKFSPSLLPVVMVTAKSQSEDIVEALKNGANDYVTKPVDFSVALARVNSQIGRRRAEARIAHMARHDPLTDLINRMVFCEQLERALADCRRHRRAFAVLCVDLDRFKAVNDTLGHPIGDALLKGMAERLRTCVRGATDAVARFGGDEFAILQTDLRDPSDAEALAMRIIETIGEPLCLDGNHISVGASVGIAIAPDDGLDPEHLLRVADLALYRAKQEGRNAYRFFEAEMDARVRRRRALELDLRGALSREEFTLHYQPILDLASDGIVGFEALLRWRSAKRGLVQPGEFISIAEESGLIAPIGDWVMQEACAAAAARSDTARIAVNVSAVQLQSPQFALSVMRALASSGLAPRRLELEITETTLLGESDSLLDSLRQLRKIGVQVALDDFGTGYSSLSYLRRFPFDTIKIDRSFVQGIECHDTAAIVHAIIDLAARLRMSVTAEGVETEDQLMRLRMEGCNLAQGYLIGRPTEADEAFAPREIVPGGRRAAE
jgi:diguanylate cyclase (GGDEF)-like protein